MSVLLILQKLLLIGCFPENGDVLMETSTDPRSVDDISFVLQNVS